MDDVIQQVVNWNPRWLEEQKKNFKSPPVYGENKKINRKTNVFSDYKEYCKTFYPLCILELWASVFKDYEQDEHQHLELMSMMYPGHETSSNKLIKLFFYSFITYDEKKREHNLPSEGWLCIIPLNYQNPETGKFYQEQVLGYVSNFKIETFKGHGDNAGHISEFLSMKPFIEPSRGKNISHFVKAEIMLKFIKQGACVDKPMIIKPVSR